MVKGSGTSISGMQSVEGEGMIRRKRLYVVTGFLGLAALVAGTGAWLPSTRPAVQAPIAPENTVRASIRGLCSLDPARHADAKAELLLSGPAAAPDLLSSLGYLVTDDGSKYKQGREIMDSPPCANPAAVDDICEILAATGCKEAVPLMVEAMSLESSPESWEVWNAAMNGLVKIGPYSATYVVSALDDSASAALRRATVQAPSDTERRRWWVKEYDYRIKARCAMVLGRIGGQEALEALKRVRGEKQPSYLYPYLDDAIKRIRLKQSGG
jgi:hypothetical protein